MTPAEPRVPSPRELNQHPDHRREKSSVGVLGMGQIGIKTDPQQGILLAGQTQGHQATNCKGEGLTPGAPSGQSPKTTPAREMI